MQNKLVFQILANAALGSGLSGSDRIFIECARRWAKRGHAVYIYVWEEGYEMCRRNGLSGVNYVVWCIRSYGSFGLVISYLTRTLKGTVEALRLRMPKEIEHVVIYSASDFLPDSIPAWILKMRFRKAEWVAGFYLFAPSPFDKASPYKGLRTLRGLLYYLFQMPVYQLVRKYADMVLVTSEPDRQRFFSNRLCSSKVIAVRGGVDTKIPDLVAEPEKKKFDAVFIGRFHPQKGVLQLIDIWRLVLDKKRDAKLAMIGDGGLVGEVKAKIGKHELRNNIVLFGFKDGIEKIKIFKDSRIVVHPAIFDSGGMAACEAMACGLPGVSFDLPALKTYYPKGMLKTPCYDLEAFAKNILELLNNEETYKKISKDALDWAKEWDWDKRAEYLLEVIRET